MFTVYVNADQESFATSRIKLVRISGGSGNDSIIVSPNLNIPCSIEGGPGNDRIGGGAANDTIFGESGNDTIAGNDGNDYFDGGAGDDVFDDTIGANVFHGGAGTDTAIGDDYDLGSGIEHRTDGGLPTEFYSSGATNLRTINGQLTLTYGGILPSTNNTVPQTGPTRLPDGEYKITATYNVGSGDAAVGSFEDQWNLQNVARSGVIFTVYDSGFSHWEFSVPLLLPTK